MEIFITIAVCLGFTLYDTRAESARDLHLKLFSNYNVDVLPRRLANESVQVTMNVALREVYKFDDREQTLKLKIWVRMWWYDDFLTWDTAAFKDIDYITVPYERVWIPDITLFDDANDGSDEDMPGKKQYRARILSDGKISYKFPTVITSFCAMDVSHFPFDIQNCTLKFGSWAHNEKLVTIQLDRNEADLSDFLPNSEWEIKSMAGVSRRNHYYCCENAFSDVVYYIEMNRKSKAHVMSLITPCVLVHVVASFGFILPVESGEKVSLQLTVLLSFVVFQLILSDTLPSSADTYPIIGIYFVTCALLCTISCLLTVVVIVIHNQSELSSPISTRIRKIMHFLKIITERQSQKNSKLDSNRLDNIMRTNRKSSTNETIDAEKSTFEEWKHLARCMDKIICVCFLIVSAIITISFIAAVYQ